MNPGNLSWARHGAMQVGRSLPASRPRSVNLPCRSEWKHEQAGSICRLPILIGLERTGPQGGSAGAFALPFQKRGAL